MALEIRIMNPADVALGMRLKQAAGWTQIEADWQRALKLEPAGCFVAEVEGTGIGTVCSCLFGPVAWIALVLVDPQHRGRGIGRAMLERAIEYCESQGADSIRLDATPLGRPLYASLGFRDDFELVRYRGTPVVNLPADQNIAALGPSDLADLAAFDLAATGTDRTKLLETLLIGEQRPAFAVRAAGGLQGFCLSRPADGAVQIGPCIATPAAGPGLLAATMSDLGGRPMIIDVPRGYPVAVRLVEAAGLVSERAFWRMTRGRPIAEDIPRLWASFGPEKG